MMSANRPDDNDPRTIAWRVFREADLGYKETILAGNSYKVYERVLGTVARIGYSDRTLASIVHSYQVPQCPHFQQWMGRANGASDKRRRHAVYALVLELQRLLGYMPQFGMISNWLFLGRLHRDHAGLPRGGDGFVDLWGRVDGQQVAVRYGPGQFDYVSTYVQRLDRAAGEDEAFRRLARELVTGVA